VNKIDDSKDGILYEGKTKFCSIKDKIIAFNVLFLNKG
jgi:hypothetical protein